MVCGALLAQPVHARADDEHVVINVVNRLVYVSLGTRDGASVGEEIDVSADGVAIGKIELDLCGEVICRGKLPNSLSAKVKRGMAVRISDPKTAPPASKPRPPPSPPPRDTSFDERPARLPYRTPVPYGYRVMRERIAPAVTVGWIGLGATYGISFLLGVNGRDESALILPIFGPFLHAATNRTSDADVGYLVLGIGQALSVAFLIAGYAGERVLIREGSVTLNVGPTGFIGRF